MDEWISVDLKLPPPYTTVRIRFEGGKESQGFFSPEAGWFEKFGPETGRRVGGVVEWKELDE